MDKLIFDNAALGFEGAWENLATLQRGVLEGFEASIKSLINNYDPAGIYVLSGCVVTVNSQDYSITTGYVFHNDEIHKVDAVAFTAPGGQIGVFNLDMTSINTTFKNGQDYEVEQTRKIKLEAGAAGSGLKDHNQSIILSDSLDDLLDIGNRITAAVDAVVQSAPGTLDTLNELAAALGDDPDFATTITNSIAGKLNKSGDTMSGNLNMNGQKIISLAAATGAGDAIAKGQMDTAIAAAVANLLASGTTLKTNADFTSKTGWTLDSQTRAEQDNNKLTHLKVRAANNGATTSNYEIAVIPVGFRPKNNIWGIASVEGAGSFSGAPRSGETKVYEVNIDTFGNIVFPYLDVLAEIPSYVMFSITYYST